MTFGEICNRVRDYIGGRSYRGQVVTNQDIAVEANHALRTIGFRIRAFDPSVQLTLTPGQATYDVQGPQVVSRLVIEPYSVTINGRMLWDSAGATRSVQSLQELEERSPGWRTAGPGQPTAAVWFGNHRLLVHSSPSSAVAVSGSNYIAGYVYPGVQLSTGAYSASGFLADDSGAVPDLDLVLHDCLCYLTSQYLLTPIADDNRAWATIRAYNADWVQQTDAIRKMNERAVSPWGIGRSPYPDLYMGR